MKDAVHLVEMDDLNLDSAWLTRSTIRSQQLAVGSDAGAPIEHLIYGSGLDSFVLDIGGNETASKTLAAVGEQMLFRHFDLVVIPVRDEGQDVDNAEKTIQAIRVHDADVKIAILLNDISSRSQNLADHALRESFAEVFDLAEQADAELLVMPRIERYGRSRRLGQTQWELAENRDELIEELKNTVLSAEANGDLEKGKRYTRLIRSVTGARQAREYIDEVHRRLDEILEAEKQRLRIMVVSTKGGVGKSVASQQLMATYLLSRLRG
ncbi:hypothetical protein LRS11_02950 [Pseudomonas sp. J452]|uniref:hypothetical protein n=1 Tax=Pseudomonas sp. J452 TaxID=2898441 RepID=UPI0021ADD578|nr:hypothetical protein [Pseudomonas sp. J452]UUY09007.1 hypothetical protein LRS11_02950 [Pseudomonas sp. J452]